MRRFALIDRDGTLNVEKHYLSDPDQLELIPGAGEAVARLNRAGWGVVVVTNQSGIARGYFDLARLDAIHERLHQLLAAHGAHIDGLEICPHGPDQDCLCRKPLPGMALQAAKRLKFDPTPNGVVRGYTRASGGHITGPRLQGKVIPYSGGDWPYFRADGAVQFEAIYLLETADGAGIVVKNRGCRYASAETLAKMNSFQRVEPHE